MCEMLNKEMRKTDNMKNQSLLVALKNRRKKFRALFEFVFI